MRCVRDFWPINYSDVGVAYNSQAERRCYYMTVLEIDLITRNVWQSLAYSPLGAAVSPPNK